MDPHALLRRSVAEYHFYASLWDAQISGEYSAHFIVGLTFSGGAVTLIFKAPFAISSEIWPVRARGITFISSTREPSRRSFLRSSSACNDMLGNEACLGLLSAI